MNTLKNFPYQSVLVLGLAKSGTATCEILAENGVAVKANDLKASPDEEHVVHLQQLGVEVVTGSHPVSLLEGIDVLIKNPGIPYDNVIVQKAITLNIPVITEIELIQYLTDNPIIGITGSNGKTTTTTLIHDMLSQSGKVNHIAGNIGKVAVKTAANIVNDDMMVVELSSFQLMGTIHFKPKIAVLLNLFEAHLDYHHTFENYKQAKARIFSNQQTSDFFVYNADDPNVVHLLDTVSASSIPFSTTKKLENGAWCDERFIYFKKECVMKRSEIVLVGTHNFENILAAVAAAMLAGATKEGIKQVLTTFSGVKHRLQFVGTHKDRLFYNDSKATNILATTKALHSFNQPVILLAGGLDRGNEFDELVSHFTNVKALVLFGETSSKLEKAGVEAGIESIIHVETMMQAVHEAYHHSNQGDVILLSPACASWDQYRTFEERGDMFIQAVHTLK